MLNRFILNAVVPCSDYLLVGLWQTLPLSLLKVSKGHCVSLL
jgi:hypothetical protein